MAEWSRVTGLVLLFGGILIAGSTPELLAATSASSDILSSDRDVADTVDIGNLKPITRSNREAVKPLPVGNPLWSVPLSALTATQERPIFSASRRPPQRAVVAPPVERVVAPPKAVEPERPPLALIGAVVSDSDAIAVFLDRSSQKIVRLRQGDTHAGWVLSSVQGREVTLKKADRTEVIAFQRPDGSAGASGPTATGGVDLSYAPFTPRSTPKNGAADGL
jgi:general secretion pathway protein N